MQLTHYNSTFKTQKFPITLVCDNVINVPNIGSILRIADAFGINEVIFCGENIQLGKRMKKTSRATEKYVNHRVENNVMHVVKQLKTQNYYLIAIEITEDSRVLNDFQLGTKQPIALIVGNENFGISPTLLKQVDTTIHINMYGQNSSMNVAQATAITLYELTKQLSI